jgi:alcohol dehydrogenase (cytochrome c)
VNVRRALILLLAAVVPLALCVHGQSETPGQMQPQREGLSPATLLNPGDSWPSYNGDYSGRRFSPLKQITASNVNSLALAWVSHPSLRGAVGPSAAQPAKATPIEVNGVLYFSAPDVAWALDARTGREMWHYLYPPNNGHRNGSRGVGMSGDWIYLVTPDNHLVCLDAKNGKQKWIVELADQALDYFSTTAPVVVRNHVIVGVGGDTLDNPGYIESRDTETGDLQWQFFTEPKPGQPGSETWSSVDAMAHGGGMPWMPGTYDPDLNLYYFGTGNPNPVHDGESRKGDNLYTCTMIALNPDTGKMAWYFQVSPHDTHDWDDVQAPILFDAQFNGKPRKLVAQAARNGYFFVLDRTNGEHLLTQPFIHTNWTKEINAAGQPIPDPEKQPAPDGRLVIPNSDGGVNWFPQSFDPETGLVYLNATERYSIFYRTAEGKGEGFAGRDESLPYREEYTIGIDYRTGKIAWRHDDGLGGVLTTAGGVLFTGTNNGDLLALDPAKGTTLWHTNVGANLDNGPITYELDNRQYVVFGVGDDLFAFTLPLQH